TLSLHDALPISRARERAEVARVALDDLGTVGERALVFACEIERRGALVPAFGERRLAPDHLGERGDRLGVAARVHLVDAALEQAVDRLVARAAPQHPERLLG